MRFNWQCLSFSLLISVVLISVLLTEPATGTTDFECQQKNASCYVCTEASACYWCQPNKQCRKYPLKAIVPSGCSKHQWYYKQCTVAGYWLIIVVPCVGIFLLLCLGCCIWCCCCRTSRAKKEEKYRLEDARLQKDKDRRKAGQAQKKADRQEKVDEIRKKYGLYQHEPSYQKMQEIE
eukprot:Seg2480.4 transcript_id=Seg2480.4/GoldUCD/mRNA.D3Y31 product="Pituitary tumor-transforming gene 1 protein-interacting protein" protein_id=Seg2480.4/GoldUCD/D3Y31